MDDCCLADSSPVGCCLVDSYPDGCCPVDCSERVGLARAGLAAVDSAVVYCSADLNQADC